MLPAGGTRGVGNEEDKMGRETFGTGQGFHWLWTPGFNRIQATATIAERLAAAGVQEIEEGVFRCMGGVEYVATFRAVLKIPRWIE